MPIPATEPTRTGAPSQRTRVHRHPERADYSRATVDAILDEALICHVAWVADGEPRVIPTIHARVDDTLYLALDPAAKRKPAGEWTILGKPIPRLDIPAMATGQFEYVHNVRVPGMLHGQVVRPPVKPWADRSRRAG